MPVRTRLPTAAFAIVASLALVAKAESGLYVVRAGPLTWGQRLSPDLGDRVFRSANGLLYSTEQVTRARLLPRGAEFALVPARGGGRKAVEILADLPDGRMILALPDMAFRDRYQVRSRTEAIRTRRGFAPSASGPLEAFLNGSTAYSATGDELPAFYSRNFVPAEERPSFVLVADESGRAALRRRLARLPGGLAVIEQDEPSGGTNPEGRSGRFYLAGESQLREPLSTPPFHDQTLFRYKLAEDGDSGSLSPIQPDQFFSGGFASVGGRLLGPIPDRDGFALWPMQRIENGEEVAVPLPSSSRRFAIGRLRFVGPNGQVAVAIPMPDGSEALVGCLGSSLRRKSIGDPLTGRWAVVWRIEGRTLVYEPKRISLVFVGGSIGVATQDPSRFDVWNPRAFHRPIPSSVTLPAQMIAEKVALLASGRREAFREIHRVLELIEAGFAVVEGSSGPTLARTRLGWEDSRGWQPLTSARGFRRSAIFVRRDREWDIYERAEVTAEYANGDFVANGIRYSNASSIDGAWLDLDDNFVERSTGAAVQVKAFALTEMAILTMDGRTLRRGEYSRVWPPIQVRAGRLSAVACAGAVSGAGAAQLGGEDEPRSRK